MSAVRVTEEELDCPSFESDHGLMRLWEEGKGSRRPLGK